MVKPIKQFEISSLKVSGFKCFAEERSFSFGPMNAIFGHNAQGKSTIADAISYAITGVSFFGSNRMDRLRAPGKNISVELQIVDGKGQPHCLIRNRVGDNTDVFWDGQPIAAKDLNTVFAERDLFLAVFNPLYLIEVLGNKGRDLFERYMPEVPHEKVMEQLSEHNQSILAQNPFLSPEALVKQTRESIRELESTLTYCQGQQDLLQSQREQSGVLLADRQKELQDCRIRIQELESIRTTGFDGSDLKERLADLYSLHEEYVREQASLPQTDDLDAKFRDLTQKRAKREADVYHSQYAQALADTQKQINELGMELARHRHILAGLQPGIRCPMCYQTVTQETLPALKDEFEATIRRICAQGKELSGQLDELHGLDEKAREVFEAFRAQDIAMCNQELADIELRRQQAVDAVRAENERRQQKISEIREEIQNIELDLETGRLSSEEMVELECFKERAKALEAEIEVLTEQQGSSMGADVAPGISAEEINAEIVKKNELLTALSSYIAERVRQRFDHLDLNRVSISLYEVSKTTGEVRDVFKFNYEDRPYVILSLSEKIKAGLEVSELLKKIAGINYPVFIDNGESVPVIDNVRPSGQTFISQVVKNEQLRVEILGAAPAGRSEQAA
ncbi:AAA family ATPase [Flavonifractor plautii]|mgnify:FL=1|uniref:AAA family ATPase n=1 Tax=Flavonifractor plautii TaxID=292800 RepID=A0AAW6C716_FLAPL|nr:AAA family ATPase [Flavonifractor plautii]MDB7886567.1 AAA family ATPase [Flavonifractor plautii]MDB7908312.1 AAA family ATPase [Flavonifractor plautii]